MNIKKVFKHTVLMLTMACAIASCSTPKNVAYVQGVTNAETIEIASAADRNITVQPHDKLSIVVTSKDPELARLFNLNIFTNNSGQADGFNGGTLREYNLSANQGISVYTVSEQGTIDFPVLGVLKIEGMTRQELAGFIKGEIMGKNLIKDPVVTVEFLNTGISVIGDVTHPGRFDVNTDAINILEAIALAGDLTINGQRENVLVMRKNGDKMDTYRLDLTKSKELMQSPAFYLKQGDVIYVEPNNIKKRQTVSNANNVTNISFWLSVASLLTTAAVLFK